MPDDVSIEYSNCRKVPIQNKEDMHSLVKIQLCTRLLILKQNLFFIRMKQMRSKIGFCIAWGKKWKAWKCPLKARLYDSSLTVDEIVAQVKNDKTASQTQFKELATRWFTPKFQSTCMAKRVSQSKMKEPHVSGTESFARPAHEMNDVVYPTRGEMYTKSQTHKDGTIVDDEASLVVAALKDIANESTNSSYHNDISNDAYSKVKGSEKRRYIRLVGTWKDDNQKHNNPSSAESETINKL
ncbi:hypothetical protein R6Q59_031150 [Mikania micrantha]